MDEKNEHAARDEEARQAVVEWIEEGKSYRVAQALLAKGPPEGLGYSASLGTIANWVQKARREKLMGEMREDIAAATEVQKAGAVGAGELESATVQLLKQRIFRAAAATDAKGLVAMMRMVQEHEARMKRLDLAKRRFEFNAAKEVMKHLAALKEVRENKQLDDQEKIWAARRIVFGPRADEIK